MAMSTLGALSISTLRVNQTSGRPLYKQIAQELWYEAPLPSLTAAKAIDGRTVALGSFSKTVFPSPNLGFVVVPKQIISQVRKLLSVATESTLSWSQLLFVEFVAGGFRLAWMLEQIFACRYSRKSNGGYW